MSPENHSAADRVIPAPGVPAFAAVAAHYDALMRDVPYESWVDHIRELLEIHGMGPRRILDLACGTGSVSQILARVAVGYTQLALDKETARLVLVRPA